MTVASTSAQGVIEEGWGAVADAFLRNFEEGLEDGAACCVYLEGRPVVDIWAGASRVGPARPWAEDTIVVVRSATKGASAMCAHMLVEKGKLDLGAKVVQYWPEYGAAGKENTLVRSLLCHEAGLPALDRPLTLDEACAWSPVIHALEEQAPLWVPGVQNSYHSVTWGFLVGEVFRRAAGETIGAFLAREVAGPLGLSSWIGLPAEEEPRLALAQREAVQAEYDEMVEVVLAGLNLDESKKADLVERLRVSEEDPTSVNVRAATLAGAFEDPWTAFNVRQARAAEFPSSNLVTDARSLARMYAAAVCEVDGVRLLSPETLEYICSFEPQSRPFTVPGLEVLSELTAHRFLLGFLHLPFLGPRSFGHSGRGGSLGLADPDSRLGFGYVMNRMSARMNDPRVANILSAVGVVVGDGQG